MKPEKPHEYTKTELALIGICSILVSRNNGTVYALIATLALSVACNCFLFNVIVKHILT